MSEANQYILILGHKQIIQMVSMGEFGKQILQVLVHRYGESHEGPTCSFITYTIYNTLVVIPSKRCSEKVPLKKTGIYRYTYVLFTHILTH